jgi:hypothetical protein
MHVFYVLGDMQAENHLFPDDVIVHFWTFLKERESILKLVFVCKAWESLTRSSTKLQEHLFKVFWPHDVAPQTDEIPSIYEHHKSMKAKRSSVLQATRAEIEWKQNGMYFFEGACGRLAAPASLKQGSIYFCSSTWIETNPTGKPKDRQRVQAIRVRPSSSWTRHLLFPRGDSIRLSKI